MDMLKVVKDTLLYMLANSWRWHVSQGGCGSTVGGVSCVLTDTQYRHVLKTQLWIFLLSTVFSCVFMLDEIKSTEIVVFIFYQCFYNT